MTMLICFQFKLGMALTVKHLHAARVQELDFPSTMKAVDNKCNMLT